MKKISTNPTAERSPSPSIPQAKWPIVSAGLAAFMLWSSTTVTGATVYVAVRGGIHASFTPEDVSIKVGDTVQWDWTDNFSGHSVTSRSGLFDSGGHQEGYSFSYTFTATGTYAYYCKAHPNQTGTVTVTAATATAAQPLNVSTRLGVQTGENVMIGGFIITGTEPKKVIIRAIGPSLSGSVPGFLADPTLELHSASGPMAVNDNWKESQQAEIEATTIPPTEELESAIVATLPANNAHYTAVVGGKNATTGIGVVEAYDLNQAANSRLANISTRGFVQTGSNVMIGGFILGGGSGNANVLVRALGPSLTQAGINGALADPTLELRDGNGALLQSNNDWKDTQQADIQASGIPPTNDLESAIKATLPPGAFTAIVAGKDNASGVGLIEVYRLQ